MMVKTAYDLVGSCNIPSFLNVEMLKNAQFSDSHNLKLQHYKLTLARTSSSESMPSSMSPNMALSSSEFCKIGEGLLIPASSVVCNMELDKNRGAY